MDYYFVSDIIRPEINFEQSLKSIKKITALSARSHFQNICNILKCDRKTNVQNVKLNSHQATSSNMQKRR
ncbi:hypothetical protein H6F98_26425 [Microcoleus sp. FACHB-SPT15]|uniref:hypothetical protein n=1 Tax=Microcoleus sp. FACHB-SPT15 TaxID=2692830 RepID=UPI00177CEF91|nr:hypothetical protein [Microcoleus sp. FACHB-SPT15]MBD1808964.1 hypothetical protein [Microcoleus sp. FACHB-SPT15]